MNKIQIKKDNKISFICREMPIINQIVQCTGVDYSKLINYMIDNYIQNHQKEIDMILNEKIKIDIEDNNYIINYL